MKKIINILALVSISVSLFSCTKSGGSSNSVSSPFTVKYEITTTQNVIDPNSIDLILYENATDNPETLAFSSGKYWSKSITVTSTKRPFELILESPTGSGIKLSAPGSVTGNIYVNGNIVATATNQTSTIQGSSVQNQASLMLVYNVN